MSDRAIYLRELFTLWAARVPYGIESCLGCSFFGYFMRFCLEKVYVLEDAALLD